MRSVIKSCFFQLQPFWSGWLDKQAEHVNYCCWYIQFCLVHLSLAAQIYLSNNIYTITQRENYFPDILRKRVENLAFNYFLFFYGCKFCELHFSEHELFTLGGTTVTRELTELWHHKYADRRDKDSQVYLIKSSGSQASEIKMSFLKMQWFCSCGTGREGLL